MKGKGRGNCTGFLKGEGQGKLRRFSQRGRGRGNCAGSRSFSNLAEATAIILTCSYSASLALCYPPRVYQLLLTISLLGLFVEFPVGLLQLHLYRFLRLSCRLFNLMRSFEKFVTDFRPKTKSLRSFSHRRGCRLRSRFFFVSEFFSEICHRKIWKSRRPTFPFKTVLFRSKRYQLTPDETP